MVSKVTRMVLKVPSPATSTSRELTPGGLSCDELELSPQPKRHKTDHKQKKKHKHKEHKHKHKHKH